MGHRASTIVFHRTLFIAIFSASPHVFPMLSSSLITVRRQDCFDLPCFLFPWGFHFMVILVVLSFSFLKVWPIHFHFLRFIVKKRVDSKELWLVQKNHAAVKLDSKGFSWNENLQRRQNWTAKSTNLKENTGKIKSVFVIRTALWAEKVGCCLEYCRSWKNRLGKLVVADNTGGHLIRVLNVRSVTDGGNLCPLWLVILKSVWHSIGDTL